MTTMQPGKNEKFNIGICQLRQSYDIEENIFRAAGQIDKAAAQGADIAVLPEMFSTPYEPLSIKKAVSFAGDALAAIRNKAQENRIFVVAGSLPFSDGRKKPYNRSVVFNREGDIIFTHDKLHLFDCHPPQGSKVMESASVRKGDSIGFFQTPWGRASVIVCYDIRFTPLTQLLCDMDVRFLFVPAAFSPSTGIPHWEMLIRMRALELQGFVVGVQPARNNDLKYIPYGHSMVASPFGEVIYDAGEEECVGIVSINPVTIENIRTVFPLKKHRRLDLYKTCLKEKHDRA